MIIQYSNSLSQVKETNMKIFLIISAALLVAQGAPAIDDVSQYDVNQQVS